MAATQSSLESQAETIRDESTAGANTATRVGTYMRELITWIVASFHSFKVVADLGTNATTVDAENARELNIRAGLYNTSTTLTFSNVGSLQTISGQITNTNANVWKFAGITVKFVNDEMPSGVSFNSDTDSDALTFPADTAKKYNFVLERFDGSTFRGKIEID